MIVKRIGNLLLSASAAVVVVLLCILPFATLAVGIGLVLGADWMRGPYDPRMTEVVAGLLLLWFTAFLTGLFLYSLGDGS